MNLKFKDYLAQKEILYTKTKIYNILEDLGVSYRYNKLMKILKEAKADDVPTDIEDDGDDEDTNSISMKVNDHEVVIYADKVVIDGKEYLFDEEEEEESEEEEEEEEEETEEDVKPKKSKKEEEEVEEEPEEEEGLEKNVKYEKGV